MVVMFAKHGALHPYVLGSKLKEDRAQIHELSALLLLNSVLDRWFDSLIPLVALTQCKENRILVQERSSVYFLFKKGAG
jgi:hypothetical protein